MMQYVAEFQHKTVNQNVKSGVTIASIFSYSKIYFFYGCISVCKCT